MSGIESQRAKMEGVSCVCCCLCVTKLYDTMLLLFLLLPPFNTFLFFPELFNLGSARRRPDTCTVSFCDSSRETNPKVSFFSFLPFVSASISQKEKGWVRPGERVTRHVVGPSDNAPLLLPVVDVVCAACRFCLIDVTSVVVVVYPFWRVTSPITTMSGPKCWQRRGLSHPKLSGNAITTQRIGELGRRPPLLCGGQRKRNDRVE